MTVTDSRSELWVGRLGRVPYGAASALQRALRDRRAAGEIADTLLLLEHDPVYTRGRRATPDELPFPAAWYAERGIAIADTDRGGRTTYHGPGQLVGYPIVDTACVGRDIPRYVRLVERALVDSLATEGIVAHARDGDHTGIWVGERKIGSIGIHVHRGVATHGFAVNVDCDLEPFEWIVPCGLDGVRMTSVARELAGAADSARFADCVADRLAHALGACLVPSPIDFAVFDAAADLTLSY